LQAFRSIVVPVDIRGKVTEYRVPFDVELMERVEQAIIEIADEGKPWRWLRVSKRDRNVREVFEEFCKPYLGDIDYKKLDPSFCPLFFSHVRRELMRSSAACDASMTSTGGPQEPTDERTTGGPGSA